VKQEHNQHTKVQYHIINSRISLQKVQAPKDASKDIIEFEEAISLMFRTFSSPKKRMLSIDALGLRVPIQSPALISLDHPLTALVGIAEKRKQILTCTQETTKAKLERLYSARLIHGDQQITTRHANALIQTKELISLLATRLSTTKPVK
jgi:hypothetical protein